MRPAEYNITHYQGDTLILPLRIRNVNADGTLGEYEDLTGWVGKAQMRNAADVIVQEFTVTVDADQVDNKGLLEVTATHTQTAVWTSINGLVWDLQLTNAGGQVRTIIAGTVTVLAEVTR